jgi:hypothetical protein
VAQDQIGGIVQPRVLPDKQQGPPGHGATGTMGVAEHRPTRHRALADKDVAGLDRLRVLEGALAHVDRCCSGSGNALS